MAIRAVGKNERIRIISEDVALIISRITTSERERVSKRLEKQGRVPEREVMDVLLQRHLHGYEPDPKDDSTWIYDDDGEFVPADEFDPKLVLNWPSDVKLDIYDKMHQNAAGEDIRKSGGREGNLEAGSGLNIDLVD